MTVQSPYIVPGLNADAVVQNVNLNQISDTSPTILAALRHGEQAVSEIHGKRYAKASRGNMFWGTSGTAGATLIAPGQTTGSFILYNPVASGVLIEVEQFRISGASTETSVVAGLLLEGSVQVPSGTLTGATVSSLPLGGLIGPGNIGVVTASSAAKGRVYKAATIAAATFIGGLGVTIQATTSPVPLGTVDFDGSLVLAPGMMINVVSAITQSPQIAVCDWVWSEWLP
jgi:hypothetical protein